MPCINQKEIFNKTDNFIPGLVPSVHNLFPSYPKSALQSPDPPQQTAERHHNVVVPSPALVYVHPLQKTYAVYKKQYHTTPCLPHVPECNATRKI